MEKAVDIYFASQKLSADLAIPPSGASGLVIFAHGSGSGRRSPRNRFVARALNEAGLATLLADLLTLEEISIDRFTRQFRFDLELLARRLVEVTRWALDHPSIRDLKLAYYGASTGAAAALIAASERQHAIRAVVSRGGRPDLAGDALELVRAPTLLIAGELDLEIAHLNEKAFARLAMLEKRLEIVPGASHLFEEPGALETVARLTRNWVKYHLSAVDEPRSALVG